MTRRWSDALAGAGLFAQALAAHPQEQADLFRCAELAVLAADHVSALRLLKEHDAARDEAEPVEPAVVLLRAVARTQAGEASGWREVQDAADAQPGPLWTSWMIALAGMLVPDLAIAGPAAERALKGRCRDPRLPVIAAAGQVAGGGQVAGAGQGADGDELTWQQCAEAVRRIEAARPLELPGEDVAGATLDLLSTAGLDERAASLAAYAATDDQLSRAAQDAWREAAKQRGIGVPRRVRLSMRGALQDREERRLMRELTRDLTCRCAGASGWAGPDRHHYVSAHLTVQDPSPVPGLAARLLSCRATGVRFLDLAREQLTLPVDAG